MTSTRSGAGLSTLADPHMAAAEASAAARDALAGAPATLVAVFATPDLMEHARGLLDVVRGTLSPEHLIGCSAEAVIAGGREVEEPPALAVFAAHLPGAGLETFALRALRDEDAVQVAGWPPDTDPGAPPEIGRPAHVVLLADPFTFPADVAVERANASGRIEVVGGMASGGERPGDHVLLLGDEVLHGGAVAVALHGAPVVTVVSQGCRPVGPEMVITEGEGAMIASLAGRPALARLRDALDDLAPEDRRLAEQGLLAGLVIDENRPDYERGDFLVRGILGADPESGAVMMGERVRVGQTMRLQVRDAETADEDLREALAGARRGLGPSPAAGGLLFACNGRGTRMFTSGDHDVRTVGDELGPVPVAGFFCNGEIGPVGGRNFLHGFTATMALFAPHVGNA